MGDSRSLEPDDGEGGAGKGVGPGILGGAGLAFGGARAGGAGGVGAIGGVLLFGDGRGSIRFEGYHEEGGEVGGELGWGWVGWDYSGARA